MDESISDKLSITNFEHYIINFRILIHYNFSNIHNINFSNVGLEFFEVDNCTVVMGFEG